MIRLLAALTLFAGIASAQISVDVQSISYRVRSAYLFPREQHVSARKTLVHVTATGNWTVALTGQLATACAGTSACFGFTAEFTSAPVPAPSTYSGTGSSIFAVSFYESNEVTLAPGVYNGSVDVTLTSTSQKVSIPVTLTELAASDANLSPIGKETNMGGAEIGCVNEASTYFTYNNYCSVPNESPATDASVTIPAVGGTFKDPVFGGVTRRMTGVGCSPSYGGTTAFSRNNTYLLVGCYDGTDNTNPVLRVSDATKVISSVSGSLAAMLWSATDDDILYTFNGAGVHTVKISTNASTLIGDYTSFGISSIDTGGSQPVTIDDWVAFNDHVESSGTPVVCATNLVKVIADGGPNNSNTYCAAWVGTDLDPALTNVDWVQVSEPDAQTGLRYVYMSGQPYSTVFHVGPYGSGTLIQDYFMPEYPRFPQNNDDGIHQSGESMLSSQNFTHITMFRDADGIVKLFGAYDYNEPNRSFLSTFRLSAGKDILQPSESGGGSTILSILEADITPGCSSLVNICTAASGIDDARFAAGITGASYSGGVTTLTLSVTPTTDRNGGPITGWENSTTHPVKIVEKDGPGWNAGGWKTCLQGRWTGTMTSSTTMTVPANCTGATGDPNSLMIGDVSTEIPQYHIGVPRGATEQFQLYRPGKQIHRILQIRSLAFSTGLDGVYVPVPGCGNLNPYTAEPKGSISVDGTMVAYVSTWGDLGCLGAVSAYVAKTGLDQSLKLGSVDPAQTGAVLHYNYTHGGSCIVEVSPHYSFDSITETFTDAGPVARTTLLGAHTALTADTNYWARLQCGLQVDTKPFRTLPTVSGTTTVSMTLGNPSISGMDHVIVDYRDAGANSWSSTSSTACASGCAVSFPASKAKTAEYRMRWLNGSTPLSTSAIYRAAVPSVASVAQSALSWSSLTSAQWAAMTMAQWMALTI